MAKSAKKGTKDRLCSRHSFSLRPSLPHQPHPIHLNASFCLTQTDTDIPQNPKIKQQSCLNCPTFNRDRLPSTPTFVLTREAVPFPSNSESNPRQISSATLRVLEPADGVRGREERVSTSLMIVEHPQAAIQKQLLLRLQRHL